MLKHKIILFDLDGTLVDTAPDLAASMNFLLARHGRPQLEPQIVRHLVGEGARKLMARAWTQTGAPASEQELDDLFDGFLEHYLANIAALSTPFPDLEDMLNNLSGMNARFAICTNKPEGASHSLLEALNLKKYFDIVIGGDTLDQRKPHPAPLLEAITRLDGTIDQAVMIGDSKTDISAARAAQIPVIAVSFGYSVEPVQVYEPDLIIDHLHQVPDAVKRIFGN